MNNILEDIGNRQNNTDKGDEILLGPNYQVGI